MCGIFALLNNNDKLSEEFIIEQFIKSEGRGPDNTELNLCNDIFVGFHRLSINGLDDNSNQPFFINNIELICNGEIYNYKKLFENIKYKATTNSDCEVIIYLYMIYGIEYTLNLLDGVFSFILIDHNINKIYICRDPYGVRPLFYLFNPELITTNTDDISNLNNLLGFASEMKQLVGLANMFNSEEKQTYYIEQMRPGNFLYIEKNDETKQWHVSGEITYNLFPMNNFSNFGNYDNVEEVDQYFEKIHNLFYNAVEKRVDNTNRPIACLLSGGLDSSIVTALVSKIYKNELETYSIGLEGSEDLKNARIVANYLNTKHTEIIVSEEDFFDAIPNVIYAIESYDTTTVRASVGNYLVAKYISENSDAKVIFNGDGADELMGGYLYMNKAGNHLEFDKECRQLLSNIHFFDVLRSDRCISTHGLEPRTPFLDREFVKEYLSIPSNIRYNLNLKQEKYLFRKIFDKNYLPNSILWRRKEAFSDGVSSLKKSWYKIIEERVSKQTLIKYNLDEEYSNNKPETLEQLYYRTIFESHYGNYSYIIPYFWMPKYIEANDASARTLEVYNEK